MNVTDRSPGGVLFSYGFRPFFLLVGVYAVVSMATLSWILASDRWPEGELSVFSWHGHEMIFGFVSALEDHCFIGPHVALLGNIKVGAYSTIGANATIREDIKIGKRCIIGAGALVTTDVLDDSVLLASPATKMPGSSTDLASILETPTRVD